MSKDLEFDIPAPWDESPDLSSCSYEVPQYLIPVTVHSTTGSVTGATSLTTAYEQESKPCTLSRQSVNDEQPSIVLDYGVAVAGIPIIRVTSIDSPELPLKLDVSFSEAYPGIITPNGDGPFPFSAGGDTQRRSRFRIRQTGYYESSKVQGSQRWMKITVISPGPFSISLSLAAFKPTTSNTALDELPGHFECSNPQLSKLWGYGARTLQLNCVPPRTIPPPWQVSEDEGILIDSQRCNAYGWGSSWADYKMEVLGKIIHDGLAWNVRVNGGKPGFLFQLNLSDHDATLEMWYGYYNKQQITLVPLLLDSVKITSVEIVRDKWHAIKTVCHGTLISVVIDNVLVKVYDLEKYELGAAGSASTLRVGSVGIGAGQDQVCRFKDLHVTSIPTKDVLYTSGLNTPAVLGDFGVDLNQLPFIFDGAKRDRYAWTADIIIGGRALYYSTAASEHIRGNIEASMLRSKGLQIKDKSNKTPALLPGGVPPGRDFQRDPNDTMFNVLTINYSMYVIMVLYEYWWYTGDINFLRKCWGTVKNGLVYIEARINKDGLIESYPFMDSMDYDYYNGPQTGVSTKRNALYVSTLRLSAEMASAVEGNEDSSSQYLTQATRTADAIQKHCFNAETGHYRITDSRQVGFQQEAYAWLIRNKIASPDLFSKLKELETEDSFGPLSFSPNTPEVPQVVSPIMSTFHVLAALSIGDHEAAWNVLQKVWEPMCDTSSEFFTGTTWEFLLPDKKPFEGQFCSYAQLFSTGPTFLLSQYVLGVEPTSPGFKDFKVHPSFPIPGLTWAQGRVPTPCGEAIFVRWQMWETGWRLKCKSPRGLKGTVVLPDEVRTKAVSITVNGSEWKLHDFEFGVGWGGISDDIDMKIHFE